MRAHLISPIPELLRIPLSTDASTARLSAPPVVCVGTFDGVHRGHQQAIAVARRHADRLQAPLWILSFHPHPRTVVNSGHALRLLTLPDERAALFQRYGADGVVIQHFDAAFAALTADEFFRDVIAGALQARMLVAGADFRFGKGRQGDGGWLRGRSGQLPDGVEIVELLEDVPGHKVGSAEIRNALTDNAFGRAIELLGHPYPVTGEVVPGLRKGREIGYPTWNLALPQVKLPPPVGVYAGWTFRQSPRPGMAYYGSNPTFGGQAPRLEINILAGSAEERSPRHPTECFWLTEFIRPEVAFADPAELIRQLADDERTVRRRLGG